jgi:hypothetical protein
LRYCRALSASAAIARHTAGARGLRSIAATATNTLRFAMMTDCDIVPIMHKDFLKYWAIVALSMINPASRFSNTPAPDQFWLDTTVLR